MKIASLAELKKELKYLSDKELIEIIADLSKFSTDNKMFLYFRIFGKDDPVHFTEMIQEELFQEFLKSNRSNFHQAKKAAQVIRRKLNKFLKFTRDKSTKVDLIIFFCRKLSEFGFLDYRHPVIENLYFMQLRKMETLIREMHEDLQYDYQYKVEELKNLVKE
jgi:hypothetical protein